jgi:hypothetical protein
VYASPGRTTWSAACDIGAPFLQLLSPPCRPAPKEFGDHPSSIEIDRWGEGDVSKDSSDIRGRLGGFVNKYRKSEYISI